MGFEMPFELYLDGQKFNQLHMRTNTNKLFARVLPKNEWPDIFKNDLTELTRYHCGEKIVEKLDTPIPPLVEPVYLFLFKTPVSEYRKGYEKIKEMNGLKTNMGDIPSLKEFRQLEIKANLEKGFYYDLISVGTNYLGERSIIVGGRLSTNDDEVPGPLTFDELKLLTLENLELTPEDARGLEATIKHGYGWGTFGRIDYAHLIFGKENDLNHGVMVQDNGIIIRLHYSPKEKIRDKVLVPTS